MMKKFSELLHQFCYNYQIHVDVNLPLPLYIKSFLYKYNTDSTEVIGILMLIYNNYH